MSVVVGFFLTLFTTASLLTPTTVAASSPGEWLNESEEASDREWREAALLALRVTGPSRTGGCGHTRRNTLVSTVSVMLTDQSAAGAPRGRRLQPRSPSSARVPSKPGSRLHNGGEPSQRGCFKPS